MSKLGANKVDIILDALKTHPGVWMSSAEIAKECGQRAWFTPRNVGAILREDYENVERKNVSKNANIQLKYRYIGETK